MATVTELYNREERKRSPGARISWGGGRKDADEIEKTREARSMLKKAKGSLWKARRMLVSLRRALRKVKEILMTLRRTLMTVFTSLAVVKRLYPLSSFVQCLRRSGLFTAELLPPLPQLNNRL